MRKYILYPDVTPDQYTNQYRGGGQDVKITEIYHSGNATIDKATGNVIMRGQESRFRGELLTSGQYPHQFRNDEFWEPDLERNDIPDSVISAPRPLSAASKEVFNPYDDVYNPEDTSVYSRYQFSENAFDDKLPIAKFRDTILRRIDTYPVIVVEGETGCGKTTQIPQYILHNAAQKRQYVNIIVTQPRRIAAISVARQVCHVNNWIFEQAGIVGYQIGSEKHHSSDDTRLLYCTTGVVLRKLMSALKMRGDRQLARGHFTHIILDEIHERDREMDLLMLLVRRYRAFFPTVKVILMSATIQARKTAEYFAISGADKELIPAPLVSVPGRTYEVQEWYLDDLYSDSRFAGVQKPRLDVNEPHLNPECVEICARMIETFSVMEGGSSIGAVLVFLPGMQEIKTVHTSLSRVSNLEVITLHSEVSVEEQRKAFLPVPNGRRKIILATNIAESSITVPDVTYVIDFCLNKVLFTDHTSSHLECLRTCWASKANCRQRAGRAGRVQKGRCYRLISRSMYGELQEFPQPEILRASLCQTVLQVKLLDMGPPRSVLANAIDPPEENRIHKAVLICKEVQALTTPQIDEAINDRLSEDQRLELVEEHSFDGDLTYLGEILANLPVDVRLGKLIIFGHMFGVAEECVIIAASLTVKSFFLKPFDREFQYHMVRLLFANYSKSDPLTNFFAYKAMEKTTSRTNFHKRGIHYSRFEEVRYLVDDLKSRLSRYGIDFRDWTENLPKEKRDLRQNNQLTLIRLAIAAAFYPNYFLSSKSCDLDLLRRELAGRSHLTTVQVSNLPQNFGFFYHNQLVSIFRRCLPDDHQQRLRIFYEQSKAYVEFIDPFKPVDEVSNCLYLAIRMRLLRRETLGSIRPYNEVALQQERERLIKEAREFYRRKNQLSPTLIMITDDLANQTSRADQNYTRQPTPQRCEMNDVQSTASLLSATTRFALPSETAQCAKVEITYILSCCQFYARFVQINDVESEYGKIRLALNDSNKPLNPVRMENWQNGEIYAALHPNPLFAYQRVKLESVFSETLKVAVLFVDIGESCHLGMDYLFECPSSVRNLRYQAVKCRLVKTRENPAKFDLARSKLSCNQFEKSEFGEDRLKQFDVEIYSVVDAMVVLDLLARNIQTGSTFSVGEFFIEKGCAFLAEETPESQADHNARNRRWSAHPELHRSVEEVEADNGENNYWPLRFSSIRLPVDEPSFEQPFHLRIAPQPSELTWGCPVYGYGEQTRIKVASDSVNCIAIEQFPETTTPNLLIAASAAKDDRSGGISLADTTLYPPKPGLPEIISMLFSPAVELIKGTKQHDYPIGILCGLGPDSSSMQAAFSDHDFYLTLHTKLTEDDFLLIKSVREGVNRMIDGSNPVITQNATQFRATQQQMIEAAVALFERARSVIEPEYPSARFVIWALPETAKQPAQNVLREISLRMHNGKNAQNTIYAFRGDAAADVATMPAQSHRFHPPPSQLPDTSDNQSEVGSTQELERNLKQLEHLLEENVEFSSVHCMICNTDVRSLRLLRLHMAASNHTRKVELLRSRMAAETAGQRDNQERVQSERRTGVPVQLPMMAASFTGGRGASSSGASSTGAGRGLGRPAQTQQQQQQQAPMYYYKADNSFDWPW